MAKKASTLTYTIPANSFTDVDSSTLTYTATLSDGSALPSWLSFDASAQKFTGTAPANPDGTLVTLSVKVTASDGTLNASDVFDVKVNPGSPKITSVAITDATGKMNNFVNAGDVVTTTVMFDQKVAITGTPKIKLNIGGTLVDATYSEGTGTNALKFTYTISSGNTDANGISVDSDSIVGTIKNAANEAATLTHTAVTDNASFKVDTTVLNATLANASSDNLLNASEKLVLSGTAEANSTVKVTLSDGSFTNFMADSTGAWQVSPAAIASANANPAETIRYVMVRRQNSGTTDYTDGLDNFALEEIKVMSAGVNIAAGKAVKLSGFAVTTTDLLTDSEATSTRTHIETATNGDVWVQVDLGENVKADSITVVARENWAYRLAGAEIYASNQDMSGMTLAQVQATNAKRAVISAKSADYPNSTFTMDLTQPSVSSLTVAGDLTYKYQVTDLAGNVSGEVQQTVTVDDTRPTAKITSSTADLTDLTPASTITVQSSKVGKAYLVYQARWVTDEASITSLDTSMWNSVDITSANTDTTMSLAGLMTGAYTLFTTAPSGNLSYVTASTVPISIIKARPVLDAAQSPALADVATTATAPTAGAVVGTLVGDLVAGISDADATVGKGIAITATNATQGTLWFTIDNGAHWTQTTGTLSDTNALLLKAAAGHRIYYAPASATAGTTTDAVTFRAWDGTSGRQLGARELIDGKQVDISAQLTQPVSPTTPVPFPFSVATDTISAKVVVAPVVLDLNQDGILNYGSVAMDVTGDGHLDQTTWASADDGVLVWDKLADGQVHNSSQYAFAQYKTTANADGSAVTDLQGLAAAFDSNQDGVFDAKDAKFAEFKVWQDANQNGVSDAGEVRSLADVGIASINLTSDGVQRTPEAGVTEAGRTTAAATDGSEVLVADAAFEVRSLDYTVDAGHLNLLGSGIYLDLASATALHGPISSVDVNGSGANTLKINLADVLPSTTLKLQGGSDDTVTLFESEGWSQASTAIDSGVVYNVWHNAANADQLLIDQHLTVITA